MAKITGGDRDQVKAWSRGAQGPPEQRGKSRDGEDSQFTDDDALVMILIVVTEAGGANVEEISEMLEGDEHPEEKYWEHLYLLHATLPRAPRTAWMKHGGHGCLYTPSFFTPF